MADGYFNFIFQFFYKFIGAFHIRCKCHKFYETAAFFVAFTEKSDIGFADMPFHMCSFFIRVNERSLHVDSHNPCLVLVISGFYSGSEDIQELLLGQCHGGGAVGSHTVGSLIAQDRFKLSLIHIDHLQTVLC